MKKIFLILTIISATFFLNAMTAFDLMKKISFGGSAGTPISQSTSVVVSVAGTSAVSGTYTYSSGLTYVMGGYKIIGTDIDGDTAWIVTDSTETYEYYTGLSLSNTDPWLAAWSLGSDGSNPVPTVTQEQGE
jgi:hypothetical protein